MHEIKDICQLDNVHGGTVRYVTQFEIDNECNSKAASGAIMIGAFSVIVGAIIHPLLGIAGVAGALGMLINNRGERDPQCDYKPGYYDVVSY